MFSVKGGGIAFVDRGDPAAHDFTSTDFTADNTWRDIDLSSIVGANACLVLFSLTMRHTTTNEEMKLRTKGNSNEYNIDWVENKLSNTDYSYDVWVQTDANGVIQYKLTAGTYTTLNLNVRGWFV